MSDLKDSNNNEPLPGQTDILSRIEERKEWHNLEARMGKTEVLEACPRCRKPDAMRPGTTTDPVNDEVYYFARCRFCGHKDE